MEAEVFEQQHLAGLQPVHRRHRGLAHAVLGELDFTADAMRQVCGHRPQRQVWLAVLGTAEVRHHDDSGAALRQVLKSRRGRSHAGVVRDAPVRQRDVQILAHEDALARDVDGRDRCFQSRSDMYEIRSTIRQLKPHSLSYQLTTLAQSPARTAVDGASTMDECGSFLKSEDTSSSWLTARMPRSSPPAASSNAALMSSAVVVLPSCTVRSTTDTSRSGTRKEMPANLPASSGSTSATARLAPVEVGMMLSAAARARRRSLCGRSCSFWSDV